MYIVVIAWIYVAVMMAVAEATSPAGSILGASITFVLYGLAPVALVIYLMSAPARRKALRAREQAQADAASAAQPDTGGHPSTDTVAPVRKEP